MGFARLSLKARALRLLAQREHSRSELQAKLARHVEEGEDLPALLDALEAQGFVSAQRVAESVVHQRAARFGARRVAQELRAKGLDEDLVRATAAQLAGTELERARAVWCQRFGSAPPPATPQERARQMRFLAARGFAAEVVCRVVRGGDEEFE
ncbi:recombination regulator RecX [Acidovorax sp. SDU_ACID1]|uniref:recombination regulator RecX n=1 Tax=Acidovorax sp. SDU_ACID1 TaxID=3136632 RepID=UPI003873682D